jgi:glyoxylase-like metal-dependent hydrolase (beta-lactamase superfamily II)
MATTADVAPVRSLAPGVWLAGDGASALVVEFRDHVLIADAPFNMGDIKTHIDSLAPGKPIRYIVPTHHHDDHSMGVRDVVDAGTAIVSTRANQSFFHRVAPGARIELVNGAHRVFSDGERSVEIHLVAGSPHAHDMFVAWLPREGILFQGDLIDTRADGSIFRGANNATTRHFADWLKRKGWQVRTFAGTHGTLSSPDVLTELLRQPILPQPRD